MTKAEAMFEPADGARFGMDRHAVTAFDPACLAGTPINPATLLATDYLNHFNDVEMILEMLPGTPDYFDEIAGWQPRSYVEHFASSSLRDAPLAIEVYAHVPATIRAPFEDVVARLNRTAAAAIERAGAAIRSQDPVRIADICLAAASELRGLIHEAGGIINGAAPGAAADSERFDAADTLFAG